MWAATVSDVQDAFLDIGSTVNPVLSNSTMITPDVGFVVHSAPHSATLAPCQEEPGLAPFINGKAEIIAVSVVLPARMISAPVFIHSCICSAPASATIFVISSIN